MALKRLCFLLLITFLWFEETDAATICPGFCVPQDLCRSRSGKVLGLCKNGGICCEVKEVNRNKTDCGKVVVAPGGQSFLTFTSPDYPSYSRGSLICSFEVNLNPEVVALKLDLVRFELEGSMTAPGKYGKPGGGCDADMFFIKGFSDWMTDPRCGQLSGYSAIVDLEPGEFPENKVTMLFITSSKLYRWKIRVDSVVSRQVKKSDLCYKTRMSQWSKSPHYKASLPVPQPKVNVGNTTKKSTTSKAFRVPWETWVFSESVSELCEHHPSSRSRPRRICKATIVDDRHVLTSFTCMLGFIGVPVPTLKIVRGSPCDSNISFVYTAEKVFFHFNYIASLNSNDVAMIRTKQPIMFNALSQPIPVWTLLNPVKGLSKLTTSLKKQTKVTVSIHSQITPGLSFPSFHNRSSLVTHLNAQTAVSTTAGLCSYGFACKLGMTFESFVEFQKSSDKYKNVVEKSTCLWLSSLKSRNSMLSVSGVEILPLELPFESVPYLRQGTALLRYEDIRGNDVAYLHGILTSVQLNVIAAARASGIDHWRTKNHEGLISLVDSIAVFVDLSHYRRWLLLSIS